MNDRWKTAAIAVCFALTLTGCAAEPPAPTEPTVEDLVAQHLAARGGAERLETIETVVMRGRVKRGPGLEALVSREVRPPGRIRTEFTYQGVTSVFACDGEVCWFVDPMSGVFSAEPMSETNARVALDQADMLGIIDWQAKGHQAELMGTEELDGVEVHKLHVTSAGGAVYIVYLDTATGHMIREETTRTVGDRDIQVTTNFADFREVDGVFFPHAIRAGTEGGESLEVTVEEIEINVELDDSRFDMPASE